MSFSDMLRNKNLKATPQRLAIYKLLYEMNTHPSADDIYSHMKSVYPTISLATVYKTLRTLTNVGLIRELNLGEENRYDCNLSLHGHLICTKCNSIIDLHIQNSLDILNDLKDGFELDYIKLFLYGTCQDCNK
jgi:Fur family peroxide stress response transcriptional regulator